MTWEERTLRLVSPLDGGDLATVYRALGQEAGGKACAVGVLHQTLGDQQAVAEQLQRRVEQARAVSHPVKAESEGVFTIGGFTALVMEYVDGKDLERIAKRAVLTGPVAAHIIAQVVELLIAAKQESVVHGLLSPGRIRVQPNGMVRVLGLGGQAGSSIETNDSLFGEDRGARRYAAPELLGGLLTSALDVYALGAILTFLVSGRWPKRPAKQAAAQEVVADGARMSVQAAGVSDVLANMVKECMALRPDARPTLDELLSTLQAEALEPSAWRQWVQERIQTATDSSEFDEGNEVLEEALLPGEPSRASAQASTIDMAEMETALNESDDSDGPALADDLDVLETVLEESDDAAAALEALESKPEPPVAAKDVGVAAPAVLGRLPPPDTDDVAARPLAVAGHDEALEETGFYEETADPDTVDQPTEEAPRPMVMEVDEDADQWDRMLGMHAKPEADIDKEWIRAARGQSEHAHVLYRAFLMVFVLIIGSWWMGWMDPLFEDSAGVEPSNAVEAKVDPEPVEPVTVAPNPEPVDEAVPSPADVAEEVREEPPASAVPAAQPEPQRQPRRRSESRSRRASPPPAAPPPEPQPDPAPAPQVTQEAEPEPAAPQAPATAAIRITGDAARVQLVEGTRRLSGGRIPPGTYGIEVVFRQGEAVQRQGQITLEAGQSAIINCKASFYRCSTRGPW